MIIYDMKTYIRNLIVTLAVCILPLNLPAQETKDGTVLKAGLTDDTLEEYFAALEKRSEIIAQSESECGHDAEIIYNELFSRYFMEYYRETLCRYVSLPAKVMVYLYDMDIQTVVEPPHNIDLLKDLADLRPRYTTSFIPKFDVGKKVVYLEPEVEETLLRYIGKPLYRWEGKHLFRNYSEEGEELATQRCIRLREFIPLHGPRWWAAWYLCEYYCPKYLIVGNDGLYAFLECTEGAYTDGEGVAYIEYPTHYEDSFVDEVVYL